MDRRRSLVSLFNSISFIVLVLIPKPFLSKNSRETIYFIAGGEDIGLHTFSQRYLPESECNSATGVRTRLLDCSPALTLTITPRGVLRLANVNTPHRQRGCVVCNYYVLLL